MTYVARVLSTIARPFSPAQSKPSPRQVFNSKLYDASQSYFGWKRALVSKPAPIGWLLTVAAGVHAPLWALLSGGMLLEKVSSWRSSKNTAAREPDLIAEMVQASGELKASFIARDLVTHGAKPLNQKYLSALRESDGEKFNEVVRLMRSKRMERMARIKSIALGVANWVAFTIYGTMMGEVINRFNQ